MDSWAVPAFGRYEWCCSEHFCTSFCADVYFHAIRHIKNYGVERMYPRNTNFEGGLPSQSWASDLTENYVVAAHWMTEKSGRWRGSEPVLSLWKVKKEPSGTQVSFSQGSGRQARRCTEAAWEPLLDGGLEHLLAMWEGHWKVNTRLDRGCKVTETVHSGCLAGTEHHRQSSHPCHPPKGQH